MDQSIKGIFNSAPLSVDASTTIHKCIELMRQKRISSLIVTEKNRPVGIYTEADMVRTLNNEIDSHKVTIRELMSAPIISASEDINVFEATYLLTTNRIRHLVITSENGELSGIITQTDIIAHFGEKHFMGMRTVNSVMTKKILTVDANCLVHEVIALMSSFTSGCAIAVQNDKPTGILTERDMAGLIVQAADINTLTMADVMTTPVTSINKHVNTLDAVAIMNRHKIRRLVIVDDNGLVSGILVQEDIIRNLEGNYIEFLKQVLSEKDNTLHKTQEKYQANKTQLENLLQSPLGLA